MIRINIEIDPSFGMCLRILKAMLASKNMSLSIDMSEHNVKQMMNRINSDKPVPDKPGMESIPFSK